MSLFHHLLWYAAVLIVFLQSSVFSTNLPPSFTQDINNLPLSESTPIGKVVFTLEGTDPENSSVRFGLVGTDLLSVNPTSGEVVVVKPLDHEINDTLNFAVTIEDEVEGAPVGGNNIVEVPVSVIVLDENDNPPMFQNVPYSISVDEDTPVGTTIFEKVLVTDADTVGNAIEVACGELPNFRNSCEIFQVDTVESAQNKYHGVIVLRQGLNYAVQEEYQFLLKATDGGFNTSTTVNVKVGDVQNTPPVFTGPLQAEVDEDASINTVVLTVHAEDADRGNPRTVVYELIENPMNYFLLDMVTGDLQIAKPLDREALKDPLGPLHLKIRASELVDGGKSNDPSTYTNADVSVTIKDVNDEAPAFNKHDYYVEIPEDAAVGYDLPNLNMTVTDPDIGNNSVFRLTLNDILHVFAIEPEVVAGSSPVAIKIMNNSLDYEDPNQRKFILLVVAKEVYTDPQLSSTATVTVTVTDANDNAPTFDLPSYSAVVSETAPGGSLITTITAKDRDSGHFGENGLIYHVSGDGADKFEVNNRTGAISVAECETPGRGDCLDFETKRDYHLSYKATDDDGRGQTTMVPLKISLADSNDNPPEFRQPFYNVFVDEGAVKFAPDLVIEAKDLDKTSLVAYAIIAGNAGDLFNIDPKTGKIRIMNNKGISFSDETHKNNIVLTVEATDGTFTASTLVNITIRDINDNAPVFARENYAVSIPEDSELGSSVVQLNATDVDTGLNAQIKYRFKKGSFNDFSVDEDTGLVTVATKLDYDRRNTYNIEVTAEDQGEPSLTTTTTLTIKVLNINDKSPYFVPSIQKAEIMKNAEVGTLVHTLVAIDPDVNSSEALNFVGAEPITALDKYGRVVESNDIFKDFFSIESSGKILVANPLQRDVAAIITITVLVTDITAPQVQQGKGSLVITITDINDKPPKFLPPWTPEKPEYTLKLQEELPIGTIVGTFTAVDEDSVIAGYYIKPENKYFEINNGTGILQVKERLDYEKLKSLNLTIYAFDSGVPQLNASALVSVKIANVNDNSPEFSAQSYNAIVKENAPNGTLVATVRATDADEGEFGFVTYNLTGQHSENFRVSPKMGEIFVANSRFLDYELLNETVIQVTASDGAPGSLKHTVSVPVYITIVDVNDNPPRFNQSSYNATISENIRTNPPIPILQVFAEDEDSGTNGNVHYRITSGNENDIFLLGEDTGILYAHKKLQENRNHYVLEIEARDGAGNGKFSDKAKINVQVMNINEHKPVFVLPLLVNNTLQLNQSTIPANFLIMTAKATDADTGESGRVTYHFRALGKNVQETTKFTVDPNNGFIKTKTPLDFRTSDKYDLTLVARDHGAPVWYESSTPVKILLRNGYHNGVTFYNTRSGEQGNSYHFHVAENVKPKVFIGQVKATVLDKSLELYYHFLSKAKQDAFFIDKLDGSIYTNRSLDREEQAEYELLVVVNSEPDFFFDPKKFNETTQNSSIANIKIAVDDVNDNPPEFQKQAYYAAVNSRSHLNTLFANVTAEDPDLGVNGTFRYYIKSSNLYKFGSNVSSGSVIPSPFNISQRGELATAGYLIENSQHRFVVEVGAKELTTEEQEGFAKVHVWIFEPEQLIRVILSRPREEVSKEKDEIVAELSNVTKSIIIVDEIKDHTKDNGEKNKDWCDMFILAVDPSSQIIVPVSDTLKIIDAKYDVLKDYYTGFAIENVVPAFSIEEEESFDPAIFALIALLLVLVVGVVTFVVVFCCLRRMMSPSLKKKDALIKKAVVNDLNTTENPLWIEQKLKIYEEQELSMQVFNEPDQAVVDQRNSREIMPDENTYATIQHQGRQGSSHTASFSLADDMADYATLSRPSLSSSRNVSNFEAAMGFQGSTFQVPGLAMGDLDDDTFRSGSNNENVEYVAQLL